MIARLIAALFVWTCCWVPQRPAPPSCGMTAPAHQPLSVGDWPEVLGNNLADAAIQAETDYRVLLDWAYRVVPNFRLWKHTEYILRAIAPAISGVPLRTWLCVPPRFGKTECALILASYLVCYGPQVNGQHGPVTVGYAAYGDDLAIDASERCQAMVARGGFRLAKGRGRKDSWSVEGGGKWYARGIGSAWHGKGIDVLIPDDLIKGSDEARSGDIRNKVWRRFMRDLDSRRDRKDASAIIGIGTRWHADDPGGRIIAGQFGEPFNIVLMPAANDNGVPLCAEILSDIELARIKRADPGGYWALYMQDPRPDGESIFKLNPAPTFELASWSRAYKRLGIFCDPAATAKTSSDNCAIGVCGMEGFGDEATMDVVEAIHQRLTPDQLVAALVATWKNWGSCLPVFVEALGTGAFLPDLVRAMCPEMATYVFAIKSTALVKVTADKYARAQPAARAFNLGRIRFCIAPWTGPALSELYAFTGLDDPFDDFVDMLAHAWNTLYEGAADTPRGEADRPDLAYDDYQEEDAA